MCISENMLLSCVMPCTIRSSDEVMSSRVVFGQVKFRIYTPTALL